MYQLIVQVLDLDRHENKVIHQIESMHFASIQEAFEDYNGKEAFEVYLACEEDIMRSINAMKEKT